MITIRELRYGMNNLKSNAMVQDKIHNMMLKNLNREHLRDLRNTMLHVAYVPEEWKRATVIPIRNQNKPSEEPESFRPISLTPCLGKIMQRIINRRISCTLEKNGQRFKTQAHFRKGRSTLDNIISLDHFIRQGFNHLSPTITCAIFLDVSNRFDTIWIQGLLFKFSNKGIIGNILKWVANLLQKSNIQRQNRPNMIWRPRAESGSVALAPSSSLLLSTISWSSPNQEEPFSSPTTLNAMGTPVAEKRRKIKLTPYLDRVSEWRRKWRFQFSGPKSSLVTFTRQKRN